MIARTALIALFAAALAHPLSANPPAPTPAAPAAPAAKAPDFEVKTVDGKTVKLSDFRGKVVVIDFWATWCGPCVRGMPVSAEVIAEYGDRVVFLPVDVDERETAERVRDFGAKKGWKFPLYLGTKAVGDLYGVSGIPQTNVIAADGSMAARHVGFPGEGVWKEQLKRDIDAALRAR